MDEKKINLILELKRLSRIDYYFAVVKLIPVFFVLLISPYLIFSFFDRKDYFTLAFLIVTFVILLIHCFKTVSLLQVKPTQKIKTLIKCINEPSIVNRIIISGNKIVFDIPDMEDETIYIKNSEHKSKLVENLKEIFGEFKIIVNN